DASLMTSSRMRRSAALVFLSLSAVAAADDLTTEFGGHTKFRLVGQSFPDDSLFRDFVGSDSVDVGADLRLNLKLNSGNWTFDTAYQLVGLQGDGLKLSGPPNDDRRLLDLTDIISEGSDSAILHRLDRLWLGYTSEKAVVRLGRQALSWGNGLAYAPMDLVNPFDPASVDRTIWEIRHAQLEFTQDALFTRAYLLPILLAFLVAAFNQLSGINFIIYFAPRIFELAGLDSSAALLSTAGIGLVNLVFTMLGLYLIDRAGRKTLLLAGSIGYILSLAAVTWAFGAEASGLLVVLFVFVFIASHALGQGAVIWVFIAEIFPNNIRTKGQSLGAGTHWVFAALITLLMPYLLGRFEGETIFAFFTAMMCLQLAFVLFLMPETKGKSLEFLAEHLSAHEHPSFSDAERT
ncbi:MAG: MFS transporter, partial [Gemmatimonadales bacterium]